MGEPLAGQHQSYPLTSRTYQLGSKGVHKGRERRQEKAQIEI
jgi:hypothetical protein